MLTVCEQVSYYWFNQNLSCCVVLSEKGWFLLNKTFNQSGSRTITFKKNCPPPLTQTLNLTNFPRGQLSEYESKVINLCFISKKLIHVK